MKRKPLNQLYHQFLKSKNIHQQETHYFAVLLATAGFITPYLNDEHEIVEYTETEKLTSRQHRNELFKLIQELK